jgi:hypothetical protein
MSLLLRRILSPYMAPEGETGGGGGSAGHHPAAEPGTLAPPSAEALDELGMTEEDFRALSLRDQQNILAVGELDDVQPFESEEQAEAARVKAREEQAAALNAAGIDPTKPPSTEKPKWTAAPPAPTAAPTPTPAPKPAKAKDGSDGSDPDDAPTTAAPPAPTTAPVAAPALELPPGAVALEGEVLALPPLPPVQRWTPLVTPEQKAEYEAAKTKLEELETQFEEGELTRAEWHAARKPLQQTVETVAADMAADRGGQRQEHEQLKARFDSWVQASFAQAKAAGIDYGDPKNVDAVKELDGALQRFANAAQLMFPKADADFIDRWALNKAHEEVAKARGITFKPAGAPPAAAPAAKAPVAPPTTRSAPPAADSHVAADEFAHLEGLTPAELERAVAAMSPAQEDRYLSR